MPASRTNKQSASPAETSSPLAYHSNHPALHLSPLDTFSLASPSDTPQPPAKKKRSHGKARPEGHIPRPPNAFIIFRTEYIKSMATQNSTPEVSKSLGERWRSMTPAEKAPWVEKAEEAKLQHQAANPGYKYKPIHPRDEFGNCIRKPRKPNRPRINKTASGDTNPEVQAGQHPSQPTPTTPEDLHEAFRWLEGKCETEFPNSALPSDTSSASASSPGPPPSPALTPAPLSYFQQHRRSSSVPLAGPDASFFFPFDVAHNNNGTRRLSKRPSTSMDFICAGPGTVLGTGDAYGLTAQLPPPADTTYLDAPQWHPGHRRSISAPGLGFGMGGDIGGQFQFAYAQDTNFPQGQQPNTNQNQNQHLNQNQNILTPINPVFGSMFDRFSWNMPAATTPGTHFSEYNHSHMHNRQQTHEEYVTLDIPPTPTALTSGLSNGPVPALYANPGVTSALDLQHPAPVATFDFAVLMREFEHGAGIGGVHGAQQGQEQHFYAPSQNDASNVAPPHPPPVVPVPASVPAFVPAPAPVSSFSEGVRFTRPQPQRHHHAHSHGLSEITPPRPLDFNELIVETY